MRLCHCFTDLIGYIAYFKEKKVNEDPPADKIRQEIDDLIEKSRKLCTENGFSREDYELAQFAVFAWIDETIMRSSWTRKSEWKKNMLQKRHYRTSNGGTKFFEQLEKLEPEQNEVREVYCLCLISGFRGKYGRSDEDQAAHDHIAAKNIKRITGTADGLASAPKEILFKESYGGKDPDESLAAKGKKFDISWDSALILLGPLFVIVTLFMLYRFILNSETIVNMVP
ncbi:MAG: DotU family type IV/VI secretion system protein [Desulfobacterales bacterium]